MFLSDLVCERRGPSAAAGVGSTSAQPFFFSPLGCFFWFVSAWPPPPLSSPGWHRDLAPLPPVVCTYATSVRSSGYPQNRGGWGAGEACRARCKSGPRGAATQNGQRAGPGGECGGDGRRPGLPSGAPWPSPEAREGGGDAESLAASRTGARTHTRLHTCTRAAHTRALQNDAGAATRPHMQARVPRWCQGTGT